MALNFLNDEFLFEFRHFADDLFLTRNFPSEPGMTSDLFNGRPVVEVVRHHREDQVFEIVRIIFSGVGNDFFFLFFLGCQLVSSVGREWAIR